MGKNGGEPRDTILTLEEALQRFARKRIENAESRGAAVKASPGAKVHYPDFPASLRPGQEKSGESSAVARVEPPAPAVTETVAVADASKGDSGGSADIVAMIDGVPRTLEDLEQLAAAEEAFREDFPDSSDEPEFPETETDEPAAPASRMAWMTSSREVTLGAIGAALLVWIAILVTRVPIVNQPMNLAMNLAKAVPTPALRASSLNSAQDMISTWVIVPDSNDELASAQSVEPEPDALEAAIKDTLKTRAFSDIGVSVSHQGDAYLAGDVYSLAEARRIRQIAGHVSGVRRVHFLHPDVLPTDGPAYFGVTTAQAPEVWGAKVKSVMIGSPADRAGVRAGDVISVFDGETVPDGKAFDDLIAQYSPGERVEFRVWHNGQPLYLVARLVEMTRVASR